MKNSLALPCFLSRGVLRGSFFFFLCGIALLFLVPASASAATTWTVTTTGDPSSGASACTAGSPCTTLRDAILAANQDSGDTIDLTGLRGTIDLTSTLPISESMTIEGPGASLLTISGQGEYQIFYHVLNSSNPTVNLSGLTFADGSSNHFGGVILLIGTVNVDKCAFFGNTAIEAGGAISASTLNIMDSTFYDNMATGSSGYGGAVSAGRLTVVNSTFYDNAATGSPAYSRGGGAISASSTAVVNSTFSGNSVGNGNGGAIRAYRATVVNSTFVGNSAGRYGGAIYTGASTQTGTVENDIFSNNTTRTTGSGAVSLNGTGFDEDHNLYYNNAGGDAYGFSPADNSTDITGKDPDLLPLGDYGGSTETMMPRVGSAAIGAGTSAYTLASYVHLFFPTFAFPASDQRGFPITSTVDIGSAQTNYVVVNARINKNLGCNALSCTLPQAVATANGQSYTDIGFDLPTTAPATINLCPSGSCVSLGPALSLSSGDTVIIGPPGGVTISGGPGGSGDAQILSVSGSPAAPTRVTLYGLILENGSASLGGAIRFNSSGGNLTVEACMFSGNGALFGGAIDSLGTLTVIGSTFHDNKATQFSGGAIASTGTLTVVNSTFYGNSAANTGGAIDSNASSTQGVRVVDSTFAGNSAGSGSGAIDASGGTGPETVENDIFAHNSEGTGNNGFAVYFAGSSPVEGYNLFYKNLIAGTRTESDANITLAGSDLSSTTSSRKTNLDPMLLPLANFGGPTETMMPEVGSAAICAGSASAVPVGVTTDQGGFPMTPASGAGACASSIEVDIGSVQTNYLLVTNTSNSSSRKGSLPYEVSIAGKQNYADIGFSPSLGSPATITLSSTLNLTRGSTVIVGPPGPLTISGGGKVQILNVSGSSTSAVLYRLTFENGRSTGNGGAIDFNSGSGDLIVEACTFSGNQAFDSYGGAIDSEGRASVRRSTFRANTADIGGAIDNDAGTLTVTGSTFDRNSAGFGGALDNNAGTLTVTGGTFYKNVAFLGGAIDSEDTSLTVVDSIFDGNSAFRYGGISSAAPTENYNLFYGNSGGNTNFGYGPGDVHGAGANPDLAPLANYGGPTLTMLPLPGSAAICAGTTDVANLPATDQRGLPRTSMCADNVPPIGIDIGSVETDYQAPTAELTSYVNSLYSDGVLNNGQDSSLLKKMDKANELAGEGRVRGAIQIVNTFIREVNGLYGAGVLTYQQASELLGFANVALAAYQRQL